VVGRLKHIARSDSLRFVEVVDAAP